MARSRRDATRLYGVAAVISLLCTACGSAAPVGPGVMTSPTPQLLVAEDLAGPQPGALLIGPLGQTGRCLAVNGATVVWAPPARLRTNDEVELSDGSTLRIGTSVRATGGLIPRKAAFELITRSQRSELTQCLKAADNAQEVALVFGTS